MQRPLRVLLTGGAGFLGGRIISELGELAAARGQEVHVRTLDLLPCKTADHSVVGDITDASTVNEAARDIDGILHTAALIDWGNTPRSRLFEVNLDGTLRVLEAARKNGVRAVVYTSTMDVVMGGGPLVGIDEDHP